MDNLKLSIKNKKTKKLVDITLLISFLVSFAGIILLWIYNTYFVSIYLLDISIIIFRTGLFIGVFAIIYGIFFENYLMCH